MYTFLVCVSSDDVKSQGDVSLSNVGFDKMRKTKYRYLNTNNLDYENSLKKCVIIVCFELNFLWFLIFIVRANY